jgi:MFS transporter, UMF1 family
VAAAVDRNNIEDKALSLFPYNKRMMKGETTSAAQSGGHFKDVVVIVAPRPLNPDEEYHAVYHPASPVPAAALHSTSPLPPPSWYKFQHVAPAQAYNYLGLGRGALVMSNIFLSTSFIYLASEGVGCVYTDETTGDQVVVENCDAKVYGSSSPTSLIANIAVVSSVLAALFMPMVGAMVDYTHHRRTVGIVSAVLMLCIQLAQVGTVASTWCSMAILQALGGFLYQVQVLAMYAYLPEISRMVGEDVMSKFTGTFTTCQFLAQGCFLMVVIALSTALDLNSVVTAQVSQAIDVVWTGLFFLLGWRLMPSAPASHALPPGRCRLLTLGFVQVYHTTRKLNQEFYCTGLKWYLAALIFAEAGVNSFTVLAVVYLKDHIGLSGTEIGIFFLVVLIATLPGAFLSSKITNWLRSPNRSWQLCLAFLIVCTAGGALIVDQSPQFVAYIWGVCSGILLGWFYPTEHLFFSMILPHGQEAELSGFFVYCTQILGWLPPLIFSILVDNHVSQTYGVMSLSVFFLIAILFLSRAASWSEVLAATAAISALAAAETPEHAVGYGGTAEDADMQMTKILPNFS